MISPRVISLLLFALMLGSAVILAEDSGLPLYVGRDVCLECHSGAHEAPRCSQELVVAHGRSYQVLSDPPAEHIALVCGEPDSHWMPRTNATLNNARLPRRTPRSTSHNATGLQQAVATMGICFTWAM